MVMAPMAPSPMAVMVVMLLPMAVVMVVVPAMGGSLAGGERRAAEGEDGDREDAKIGHGSCSG